MSHVQRLHSWTFDLEFERNIQLTEKVMKVMRVITMNTMTIDVDQKAVAQLRNLIRHTCILLT